jgi:Copper transport outer membrane protein, MctB
MLGVRYHVASLAAVFLALAVGILLGVAISGKLSDAEESLQQEKIQDLEQDLKNAQGSADSAARRGAAAEELLEGAYPVLMENRLEGRRIALVFLGSVDGSVRSAVERTLTDADGAGLVRTIGLDVPVDSVDLQDTLQGDEQLAAYASDEGDFGELGRELGRELVVGGDTELWNALQSKLVAERSGGFSEEVDAVVVRYSWTPTDSQGDSDSGEEVQQLRATTSLLEGLVHGLDGFGLPVVGVAGTEDPQDLVELYRDQGLSSVDDIDTFAGRLALAVLLADGKPGHYGIRDSATDGVMPPIEPVPQTGG